MKIMASGPITSWQRDGETMTDFIFLSSKITADSDSSCEIKRHLLLGREAMTHLDSLLKSRDITSLTKVCIVKAVVFLVVIWMWELDHKESWALKNWCFWTVVLEETLESPLDCKKIQPVHPKGDQSWVFIGRTDVEAETPLLWPPYVKSWLIRKDSDAGKDWGQEEKGMTEDKMVGWHHWLHGHEFGSTPGVGDGQGGLAWCSPWGRKESDTTEGLNWTELAIHRHESAMGVHVSPILNLPPTSLPIPQGRPSAPALSALSHASNLDWWSISHMVIYYMFQCYSLKSSYPCLFSQSPKVCSLHLCLFFCLAYRVIVTIFLNSIYMC